MTRGRTALLALGLLLVAGGVAGALHYRHRSEHEAACAPVQRNLQRLTQAALPGLPGHLAQHGRVLLLGPDHLTLDVGALAMADREDRTCPDPVPVVTELEGVGEAGQAEDWVGLANIVRSGPLVGVAAQPATPMARVFALQQRLARAGHRTIQWLRLRCDGACTSEVSHQCIDPVEGAPPVSADASGVLDILEPLLCPSPNEHGNRDDVWLELQLIEREDGWAVRGSGGWLAPGCQTTTTEPTATVSTDEGTEGIRRCLFSIKQEFPDEAFVRIVPRAESTFGDVAEVARAAAEDGEGQPMFSSVWIAETPLPEREWPEFVAPPPERHPDHPMTEAERMILEALRDVDDEDFQEVLRGGSANP